MIALIETRLTGDLWEWGSVLKVSKQAHYPGKKNKQGKLEHIEDNDFIFKKIN